MFQFPTQSLISRPRSSSQPTTARCTATTNTNPIRLLCVHLSVSAAFSFYVIRKTNWKDDFPQPSHIRIARCGGCSRRFSRELIAMVAPFQLTRGVILCEFRTFCRPTSGIEFPAGLRRPHEKTVGRRMSRSPRTHLLIGNPLVKEWWQSFAFPSF